MDAVQLLRAAPAEPVDWKVPAALAAGAPLAVVLALAATGNVFVAFVAYHVLLCLVVPAIVDRARGLSWSDYARKLGLVAPSGEGWAAGLMTGVAMAALVLAPFLTIGDILVGRAPVGATLSGWGVPLDAEVAMFAYMLVFNSGAEELFWRGYLHTEIVGRLGPKLGIGVLSVAFTSYHVYTFGSLVRDWRLAAVGTVAIFASALVWAFLRERYQSVLPAVLSHAGATAGYMAVFVMTV